MADGQRPAGAVRVGRFGGSMAVAALGRQASWRPVSMWKTISYLSLMCAVFIALLIGLSIVGLKS